MIPPKFLDALVKEIHLENSLKQAQLDPYWPKWDNIWWKLSFLDETGNIHLIKKDYIEQFLEIVSKHYLEFFPRKLDEIPGGTDVFREILCFCALGTLIRISVHADVNLFDVIPWAVDWTFEYQLPDGGYNCDEQSYINSRKSSLESSLPMLEGLLDYYLKYHDHRSIDILEKGFQYFDSRHLCLSSEHKIINEDWNKPLFPRFYYFDRMRILKWYLKSSVVLGEECNPEVVEFSISELEKKLSMDSKTGIRRLPLEDQFNLNYERNQWNKSRNITVFSALQDFYDKNLDSQFLSEELKIIKSEWTKLK